MANIRYSYGSTCATKDTGGPLTLMEWWYGAGVPNHSRGPWSDSDDEEGSSRDVLCMVPMFTV